MGSQVTRRSFVQGAAVSGAAMGLMGMAGSALAANASLEVPQSWDEEHDVVVVGGGVGLAAAIEAAEGGSDTILLEKGDHTGGLWMTAGGSCTMGGGTCVQKRDGIEDDVDSWYEAEMRSCEYRGVPEIMRMLCEKGPDTVQWMEDLGIVWAPSTAGVLGGDVMRGLQPDMNPDVYAGGRGTPNAGLCWTQVWERRLEELGVPMLLNHRMTRVYRDGDGPVVGVEVETPEGAKNIKARQAVILCTGTWTDNARMAAAWDPRIVGENCYGDGGIPAENLLLVDSSGDGHIAANKIGATFSDMSFVSYLYLFFGSRSYWGWGEDPIDWTTNDNYAAGKGLARKADLYQKCILVNGDGVRYVNEASASDPIEPGMGALSENPEMPFMRAYLAQPAPRNIWLVGDAAIAEELSWPMDQIEDPNPRTGNMFDPACVAIADTLEELAAHMGVDPEALVATVEGYNAAVDAGVDEGFGKANLDTKIESAPFYGFKASLIRHTQRNGLRVNTKSQVIDGWADLEDVSVPVASIDDEPVIPHLYAAGELGNVLGWRRVHNSLGHYTTAARNAGQNAALEEPIA